MVELRLYERPNHTTYVVIASNCGREVDDNTVMGVGDNDRLISFTDLEDEITGPMWPVDRALIEEVEG